jgi:hypothetical protein
MEAVSPVTNATKYIRKPKSRRESKKIEKSQL